MQSNSPTSLAEGALDVKVRRRFFPRDDSDRTFVEVGAARPDYLSISAHFRELGWRVIAVEPNPEFCEIHKKLGYDILQFACGDRDEDNVDFTIVDSSGVDYRGGKVTFESFSSLGVKESFSQLKDNLVTRNIKVNLRKLDTILETYAPEVNQIDILSIDVEGWELEVLSGLNIKRFRPRCVILENLFSDVKYERYMRDHGYVLWRTLSPNQTFISSEMRVSSAEVVLYRWYDSLFHRG